MMIYLQFLVLFFGLCGIPATESTDTCHSCYQGKLFKDVFTRLAQTMTPGGGMPGGAPSQEEILAALGGMPGGGMPGGGMPDGALAALAAWNGGGMPGGGMPGGGMPGGGPEMSLGDLDALIDLATLKMPAESAKCLNPDNTVPTEECDGGKCMALSLNIPGIGNNTARACIPGLNALFRGHPEKLASLGFPVDKVLQHVYEFILHDLHAGMTVTLPSSISADVKALAKSVAEIDIDTEIGEMKELIAQSLNLNHNSTSTSKLFNQISGGKFDADLFIKDASAAPINVINTVAINSKTCQAAVSPTTCVSCFQGALFKELFQLAKDQDNNLTKLGVPDDMSPFDLNVNFPTESEKCLEPDSTVATQKHNGGKCVGFILTVPGIGVNVVRTAFPKIETNSEHGKMMARYINDFHGSVEIILPESFSKFKEILKADFDVDIDKLKAQIPQLDYVNKLSPGKLSIDTFVFDKCSGNGSKKSSGNGSSQVIGILYMIMLPLLIVLL